MPLFITQHINSTHMFDGLYFFIYFLDNPTIYDNLVHNNMIYNKS